MVSFVAWLDDAERDRRKVLDAIDLFKERDTRDELGIGTVRDAFADRLFPGSAPSRRTTPTMRLVLAGVSTLGPQAKN